MLWTGRSHSLLFTAVFYNSQQQKAVDFLSPAHHTLWSRGAKPLDFGLAVSLTKPTVFSPWVPSTPSVADSHLSPTGLRREPTINQFVRPYPTSSPPHTLPGGSKGGRRLRVILPPQDQRRIIQKRLPTSLASFLF